jgi:hypothetical protein
VTPSLFSLWLFPAVISVATVLLAYCAARSFFSRTFSLLYFSLFAFSFWHLYTGTFCQWGIFVFLWEILTLGALGYFLRLPGGKKGLPGAILLGFLTGAGLFAGISWPVMLALITGTVYAWSLVKEPALPRKIWIGYLGPVLLFSFLFLWAGYVGQYGQHIRQLWIGEGNIDWGRQIQDCFCYLSTLFFQPGKDYWHWVVWGGMFNPLAGALFLTGLLEVWRARKSPFSRWLMIAMALSFLPGLVARNFEIYRILLLFPLMLVPCVMGILALVTRLSGVKKLSLILGFLLLSSGLDLYHLWGPYHQAWGIPNSGWSAMKSVPLYRAYQVLDQNFRPQGPGAVLSDLFPYSTDETLTTATYPFNAAQNPSLSLASVQWVALLLDPDFKPFLSRRFPSARWFWLGILPPPHQGGIALCVIPLTNETREELEAFIRADRAFQPVTSAVVDLPPRASQGPVLSLMEKAKPGFEEDPFLRACWWEKAFQRKSVGNDFPGMLEAIRRASGEGYPCAHFYNEEGLVLEAMGRRKEARRAFQKALGCPLNLTPAAENLKALPSP